MRILYVGTERAGAQAIATAVNSLGATVSWTSGLDRIANWIDENDGVRVLVVEVQPHRPLWRSVLTYAAGLPAALPVVVIAPEEVTSDLHPPAFDGHECIARNPSLLKELPAAITRAIEHAQQRQIERAARDGLELKLAQFTAAAQEAEHRHQSAIAAAAEQLAKNQAQYEMAMARAAATQDMVNEQFREAAIEVERVRLRQTSAAADAERLARREAELSVQLESATSTRSVLEHRLADAETALAAGEARAAEQRRSVAELVAERQREFERRISEEIDKRRRIEDTLNTTRHELESTRGILTSQLREVEAARDQARREQQSAISDVTRLTERERELDGRLEQERETREGLQQEITRATAARCDEQEHHRTALASVAAELAERQAQFDRERGEADAKHAGLTAQLREMEEARDQALHQHHSAVADLMRLTEREGELEGRLKEERETRDALEQEVARAATARRDQQEEHRTALATAAAELAERQAQFDRARGEADEKHAGLTAQLREMEQARDEALHQHQSAVADLTRLTEREAALEARLKEESDARDALMQQHREALAASSAEIAERQAQFDRERAQAETKQADLTAQLREVEEARDHARREHGSVADELARVTEHAAGERAAAAACQTNLEVRVSEANEKIERLDQTIDALRAASIAQSAQFDDVRREHDGRLAKAQDVISTLTTERIVLQESLDRLTREHAAVLATRESEIKQLQAELQKNRADNHRLFQQAALPMFRCTKEGALTQANRVLTTLVGRRSPEELRVADWAAAIFESPNDLSWLIERCLGSKAKESTETAWRRKDGSRLLVRLTASATSGDVIEIGVEDLTPIRVLNDRLSQAHRMEAVGRFATEVAVTCGGLLGSVHRNAQQLLMTDDSDPASRHRAEMLLDEISRAAGLLRQLAAYGDEEGRKPAMVELGTVVRDMAPILKRVAGDAVEVQLPAPSAPINVDAGAERVQRLLVNLAVYGRERMPLGGQLKIELGTIVVDRHFVAKHPNVRLGPHALVTVTESRRAPRTDDTAQLHEEEAGSGSPSVAVQRRVDLGTLQELVAECGGHLWMTVEPAGDMVVKIRLPLVTSYGEPPRRAFGPRGRVRTLGHWFQH